MDKKPVTVTLTPEQFTQTLFALTARLHKIEGKLSDDPDSHTATMLRESRQHTTTAADALVMANQAAQDRAGLDKKEPVTLASELAKAVRKLINTTHATGAKCSFGTRFAPRAKDCDCTEHDAYWHAVNTLKTYEG